MSILFKSITTASSCSLCLLISISRDTTLVTSLFFVLSALKTSNEKFISLVCICFSLTSCLSIPIYVHLESTSVLTLRFLLFFCFHICSHIQFSFYITPLVWNNIFIQRIYREDLLYYTYLIFSPKLCFLLSFLLSLLSDSSSTVSFYSPLWYVPLCCI